MSADAIYRDGAEMKQVTTR